MQILEWFKHFIKQLWLPRQEVEENTNLRCKEQSTAPEILFKSISIINKTPKNDTVGKRDFIAVVYQNKPMWALFQCPCGCGKVISLSLQKIHTPNWTVRKNPSGRPTLHPSVWQNKGCCSHFWIKDGRVYWCDNTGIEPCVAEPKYYSRKQRVAKYV